MQIIRYHEMELLLSKYRDIETAVESIEHELMGLSKGVDGADVDDFIESLVLKGKTYDDIKVDTGGVISDKTANVGMSYHQKLEKENNELSENLQQELFIFKIVLDKLNIGLRGLPEETTKVIAFKYFDNLIWNQIEDLLLLSKSQSQGIRKKGIERLIMMSRITIAQYNKVMKLLNI